MSRRPASRSDVASNAVAEIKRLRDALAKSERSLSQTKRTVRNLLEDKKALEDQCRQASSHAHRVESKLASYAKQSGMANMVQRVSDLRERLSEKEYIVAQQDGEIRNLQAELVAVANALAMREIDWCLLDPHQKPRTDEEALQYLEKSLLRALSASRHESEAFRVQLQEAERQLQQSDMRVQTLDGQLREAEGRYRIHV
ncbi:hypothetical protein KIPB_008618 [Kipferlia bialata]|uniref:Uncharacterized protein n=1 Tax=Kipferlia bialata TaxID=797122 RepID=A0A9K3D0Y0_9EUKA|nr:hypothetical protein KIPB_008618 [Kipferlia bialata]|eukprot:g8618.t1